MGTGFSRCFNPDFKTGEPELNLTEPLDETLGHSFCYVRSSARFVSPTHSDRFVSPSQSLRFDSEPVRERNVSRQAVLGESGGFRAISGASVSANASTPRTILQLDEIFHADGGGGGGVGGGGGGGVRGGGGGGGGSGGGGCGGGGCGGGSGGGGGGVGGGGGGVGGGGGGGGGGSGGGDGGGSGGGGSGGGGVLGVNEGFTFVGASGSIVNGFESTSSFSSLPLQRVPRGCGGGGGEHSGLMERALFMSGPIERGALSGPLDRVPFSEPLGGMYVKRKRKKGISGIGKALRRNFSEKRRWVVPVRNFVGGRKDVVGNGGGGGIGGELEMKGDENVQWALGEAGEDRVHVVVSEEHGWLFVGIYDGFNGPDAPEFLMSNLYKAMYKELEGLFWDNEEINADKSKSLDREQASDAMGADIRVIGIKNEPREENLDGRSVKKVTFHGEEIEVRRRRLWEFLMEEEIEDGLDLSGSDRFAFSVDDALSIKNTSSAMNRRSLLLSKLKHGLLSKHKEGRKLFPWKFGLDAKEKEPEDHRSEEDDEKPTTSGKRRKEGPVDHKLVLQAMTRVLEVTELAYLNMTDKVLDRYPELALMGSCLLVALMRDEDVYVMNVGDSRAILAQVEEEEVSSAEPKGEGKVISAAEDIVEESTGGNEATISTPGQRPRLMALQLSTDHSTSIEEEVARIKNEHPDDINCIVNDRVKGRLKVTRAFGAGFLKQPKLNNALLEMFRNEYIGTTPYLSWFPSLRHHRLCPRDQFLVLSSDGLYQYLTNEEVVSFIENFMEKFPDGDPAQHLIEELLLRAAKKAGMDFHELLDIPQGDRRKYHDDVTVMVISLEGRIWKSSGKCF